MNESVVRTNENHVVTLTLNRPDKLNALNVELFGQLERHLTDLERDDDTEVVVLRGAGRCFSAGHDLADLKHGEVLPRANYQSGIIERLANFRQPVICAVHGYCYTGALELALAADLIVATESAQFADTHAKWGLTPIWGMSQRLPRRVGSYAARKMMFTAQPVSGRVAETMGLVEFCFPDLKFEQELARLVADVTANSAFSNRANKRLLMETDGMRLAEGLAHEIHRGAGFAPDAQERMERFLARKRKRS